MMDVVVDEDVARHWQQNHFKQMGVVVGLGEQTIVASFPTPSTESGMISTTLQAL